jgi:hypothetical protein
MLEDDSNVSITMSTCDYLYPQKWKRCFFMNGLIVCYHSRNVIAKVIDWLTLVVDVSLSLSISLPLYSVDPVVYTDMTFPLDRVNSGKNETDFCCPQTCWHDARWNWILEDVDNGSSQQPETLVVVYRQGYQGLEWRKRCYLIGFSFPVAFSIRNRPCRNYALKIQLKFKLDFTRAYYSQREFVFSVNS